MNTPIADQIHQFFSRFPMEAYKTGTILVEAGQQPRGIFFIESGIIKMYSISSNGEEIVLNMFKAGAFLPMSWAINQTENPYYYEAVNDPTIRCAPRRDAVQFIKDNPDVAYDLLSRVYRGSDGLLQRMNYLLIGNKYANVITELLITAKRFGKPGPSLGSMVVTINQQQIASQSGMARETVSREMSKLKQLGLIEFNRNELTILNVNELEQALKSE